MGTLTTYRLILGRCLLAMQRSEHFREFGCSGAVHYAISRLGMADWQAREHLRMALRGARSVDIHEPVLSELRLRLSPALRLILSRTLQVASQLEGRVVGPVELLEMLCVDFLGGKLEVEADLAVQAENDRALECCVRDEIWAAATACQEEAVPGNEGLALVRPAAPHWQNERLAFNPESRLATPAQRSEWWRRDGYRCKTPGCPNHLFLQVHPIKFYSERGETVPENLVCLCSKCHRLVHEGHLRIVGEAPHRLRFLDGWGRDLGWQSELELAQWLDFFVGWRGAEEDGFEMRLRAGGWKVAA